MGLLAIAIDLNRGTKIKLFALSLKRSTKISRPSRQITETDKSSIVEGKLVRDPDKVMQNHVLKFLANKLDLYGETNSLSALDSRLKFW